MKIQDIKNLRRVGVRKLFFWAILLPICMNSGCKLFGVLATPGAFEKKIPPQYDLAKQQDRKIFLWVECPRSAGVDYDVQEKLTGAFVLCLTKNAGIRPENIILEHPATGNSLVQGPVKVARELHAGLVLVVQVEAYGLTPMTVQNYCSGQMTTRSVLMDTDSGTAVWPSDPAGKVITIGVDLETKGRDMTVNRLVSGAAHCTTRYLYPCEKLKFKISDEKMSVQDAMDEMDKF